MPSNLAKWFGHSKRLSLIILVALFLVVAPLVALNVLNPGEAKANPFVSITVTCNPSSPLAVAPGGQEDFGWTITWDSTANYYTFEIRPGLAGSPIYGPISFPVNDASPGEHSPIIRDIVTDPYTWNVPSDQATGTYTGWVFMYTSGGSPEAGGFVTFYVASNELKVRKWLDSNGNGVWDSGEPELTNYPGKVTITPVGYPPIYDGPMPITLSNIASGDYTITEQVASGWSNSTATTQSVTLGLNDKLEVDFGNQQTKHPPLVPTIGTWGAALMAAAFAGSLIWVVALRRRRRTV
jgi:hypothetical protein